VTTISDARGKEREIKKMRRNYMLRPPAQPRHRDERAVNAADADEDFTMRKELDAFFKATERWHLTPAERRALLGVSSEERWLHCLHDADPQVSPQESARVRAVIQIDETLAMCVSHPREMALWFRTLKVIAPFFGRTPLALLFRDMTGFKAVVEHLAAWHAAARKSES
jgi:hypothetical protein